MIHVTRWFLYAILPKLDWLIRSYWRNLKLRTSLDMGIYCRSCLYQAEDICALVLGIQCWSGLQRSVFQYLWRYWRQFGFKLLYLYTEFFISITVIYRFSDSHCIYFPPDHLTININNRFPAKMILSSLLVQLLFSEVVLTIFMECSIPLKSCYTVLHSAHHLHTEYAFLNSTKQVQCTDWFANLTTVLLYPFPTNF